MRNKNKSVSLIVSLAVLLEWINIVLFMAALGVEIDISIYNKLKNWKYISNVFYLLAAIDSFLFGILFYKFKKKKEFKQMTVYMFCSLLQLILIIYKLNIW